jgi:energy-converting hydrogenase Eha subunit H
VAKEYMRTLLFLIAVSIIVTSCGPNSSPEKRMNIKNHELEQKVEVLVKQQQIIRDSITILNTKIDGIKKK